MCSVESGDKTWFIYDFFFLFQDDVEEKGYFIVDMKDLLSDQSKSYLICWFYCLLKTESIIIIKMVCLKPSLPDLRIILAQISSHLNKAFSCHHISLPVFYGHFSF